MNRPFRGTVLANLLATGKDFPDVATLVSKMKEHPCTSGWDAVCSYDGKLLNDILKEQFRNLHQISTINLGISDRPYRTSYTVFNVPGVTKGLTMSQMNYHFNLDLPILQFSNTDDRAALTMRIASASQSGFSYTLTFASDADQTAGAGLKDNTWYVRDNVTHQFQEETQKNVLAMCWDSEKGKAKEPFPSHYYYKVNADIDSAFNHKLYNLSFIDLAFPTAKNDKASDPLGGKEYLLQGRVPLASVAGNQVHPSGTIVTFDASSGRTEGQIVLDFNVKTGTGTDFSLLDNSGAGGTPAILKDAPTLLDDLKVYFSTALSDVRVILAGVSAGKETPGKIPVRPRSFVFRVVKIGDASVLSIYMNIDGSATPDPGGRPSFQYNDGNQGLPVPQGYSGSLILSRDYLANHYFPQAFARVGFQVTPKGDTNSPIALTANLDKPTTIQGKAIPVTWNYFEAMGGFQGASFSTIHVDKYQFDFTFKSDNSMAISSNRVAIIEIPIQLRYVQKGWFQPPYIENRTAKSTLSIEKSISLADALPDSDGFQLKFSIEQKDYRVRTTSDIPATCDSNIQRDVESAVRIEIGDIAPNVAVDLPELQTLAIENMLFNGDTKFHLDPKSKMNFPHDLLLLGNLK